MSDTCRGAEESDAAAGWQQSAKDTLSTVSAPSACHQRQRLYDNLERYRALRDLTTDEAAIEAIDVMIRATEDLLAQVKEEQADRPGLSAEGASKK